MRGLPKVTSILIWVTALAGVLAALSDWRGYLVFKDDLNGWNSDAARASDVIALVSNLVTAVVFIIWLRRARDTAERLSRAPHRHSRGWVIGGWLVPIISLWFPKQIVDDIIAASMPETSPHAGQLPPVRSRIVQIWWATWIASNLLGFGYAALGDESSASTLLWTALFTTAATVATIVCAVYAVRVIQLITNLQTARPADVPAPGSLPLQH